ncbi:MAG: serine/threonine protein kinase, partial [Eubacterium sp.]|nr:serine/threonine protein kinase [Eubacterium sp.]
MLAAGDLLGGRYRIERLLGRGGMSNVYLASDVLTGHLWAVKELRSDCAAGEGIAARGALTELRLLKALRHPMLPALGDVLPREDGLLLVMDYIPGRDLAEVLAEEEPSREEILRWGIALCGVLEYLHTQSPPVVYRDLKPANVILREDGSLCLIDFGSAVLQGRAGTGERSLGTMGYAAPEQLSGGETDGRTDLYSLGRMLERALSGGEAAERSAGTARLPKELRRVLEKACKASPEERYQTAGEMRAALRRCLERRGEGHRRGLVLLLCAAMVLLSAGGALLDRAARIGEAARYEELLYAAQRSASYEEKLADYRAAAALTGMAGDERAYLGLLRACREDDRVFSPEERQMAERLIASGREALQEEPRRYGRVCLEMGMACWSCGEGGYAGPIAAARWFG